MTDRDYLWCAVNLLLDEEERLNGLCPSCRASAVSPHCPACGTAMADVSGGENQSFDVGRFDQLRRRAT